MIPRRLFAFAVTFAICCEDLRSLDIIMHKSFTTDVFCSSVPLSQYSACRLPCPICMVLHLMGLKFRSHFSLHSSSLFMSRRSTSMSSSVHKVLYILESSASMYIDNKKNTWHRQESTICFKRQKHRDYK